MQLCIRVLGTIIKEEDWQQILVSSGQMFPFRKKIDMENVAARHILTYLIGNLILWAGNAIKTTGSLALLSALPESRTATLTAYRVWSLEKIR